MSDEALIRVAKNIRHLRLEKKLTQKQLAKKAKMHPSYISKIENAKLDVFLTTLFKLANALDASLKELVKQKELEK